MAARILDPNSLILSGAVIDWISIIRRQQPNAELPALLRDRQLKTAAQVQLRWLVSPKVGLPTQPFQVWNRPHGKMSRPNGIPEPISYNLAGGQRVYAFAPPLGYVQGTATNAGTVTGLVIAYAGAPYQSAILGVATLAPGAQSVRFGGGVAALLVSAGVTLSNLSGSDKDTVVNDPSWQKLELVGLPVGTAAWSGVFGWGQKQGMSAALVSPVDAALDRYRRGAPFLGWPDPIAAGLAAPAWIAPEPKAILKALQVGMLDDLRTVIGTRAPAEQDLFRTAQPLPLQGGGGTADTDFSPVSTLLLGVASDPQSCLIAGFGTAYELPATPARDGPAGASGDDFMVTAFYEKGLDGNSAAIEFAAVLFSPGPAPPPAPPTNLVAPLDGLATPEAVDGRYRALTRIMWDLLPPATPFRIASYAAARAAVTPTGPLMPLMRPRLFDPGKALQPISATTSEAVATATGKIRASDDTYRLDPAAATNVLRYAIAHQDQFGVWSAWATADTNAVRPAVQRPRLLAARFDLAAPPAAPASVCTAALTVDLSWDWTVRRPRTVTLAGRLYPAAKPGAPPGNMSIPAGLPTSLASGAGSPFLITFNGADTATVPSGTLQYISDDAKSVLTVPVIVTGPRRYRIVIPGFQLDFAATGHIGLALWAQGQEQLAPQNVGDWTLQPILASASDPRPPVITAEHEDVELASLPDARGEHRARLSWAAMNGASGYAVYHATESKFRIAAGLGEPPSDQTLSQRLLALRNAFQAKPLREPFTRLTSTPLSGTSTEVVIERGSKELHLYLVIGMSAGLIESAWPNLADPNRRKRFQAFAAPQVVPPTTPRLEVVRTASGAGFAAKVVLTTRPGAPVTRLDLFRTRVPAASLELDTMGPAAARIAAAGPVWTVVPTLGPAPGVAQALGTVTGLDTPGGSWKRVYYRAVALSGGDPARGIYGGRSQATGATWVVIPPDAAPDVSPLTAGWPGGPLNTVQFAFTATAPVTDTDLGPHRLRLEAFTVAADGMLASLFVWPALPGADDRLSAIPAVAPATVGVWRDGAQFRIRLARPAIADTVRLRLLLTDPLGRATQQMLDSPGGSPLPAPTIALLATRPATLQRSIVSFNTDALFTATPMGPYTLRLRANPKPTIPRRLPVTQTTALNLIEQLTVGSDPFTDAAALPLRRQGPSHIAVFLRAGLASLQLTLTAPDGQTAQATVELP